LRYLLSFTGQWLAATVLSQEVRLAGDGTSQMAITSDGTCSRAEAEGARALSELQDGRLRLGSREGAGCTLSFTVPLPSNEQALSHLLMVAEEGI
jgi:hypothetical protein